MALNARTLKTRLRNAGYPTKFVESVLFPDWWDASCEPDPSLLDHVIFRVAQFLHLPIDVVRGDAALATPTYPGAKLRHTVNQSRSSLEPSIHVATRVAEAFLRNARDLPAFEGMTTDAARWRSQLLTQRKIVDLRVLLADLWRIGIPVLYLTMLPSPVFQAMATIVAGRPVIVLGRRESVPAKILFHLAHELGHIAHGDCAENAPVIDDDDTVDDESDNEKRADAFAFELLAGEPQAPQLPDLAPHMLARTALAEGTRRSIDAGHLVLVWARRTGDWQVGAPRALSALGKDRGGDRVVWSHVADHLDVTNVAEPDLSLLRCIASEDASDASRA